MPEFSANLPRATAKPQAETATKRQSKSEAGAEAAQTSRTPRAKSAKAKRDVKHITLRLSRKDWMLLTSFTMQRETSIQRFALDAMNEVLARSSAGPLTGPELADGTYGND